MALTALDPQTALIVVDLQQGIIASQFIYPIAEVIERTLTLVGEFRRNGLPVALVNVAGRAPGRTEQPRREQTPSEGWTTLIAELDPQPGDILVTKRTWCAFANTDPEAGLKQRGVSQVVVTGVATGTGVESTAHQAFEHGFNVTLAIDAMTDVRPEAHAYSTTDVFPRLGESGTTQQIIDLRAARIA